MALIQEDRADTRIYRGRVQNICYSLCVASFAISAFLIGNVQDLSADQLRHLTLLIDVGLVATMVIFYGRLRSDLVVLRKALKARQNLLNSLSSDDIQEIDPFLDPEDVEADIHDTDLFCVLVLSVIVVLLKRSVLAINPASFVGTT